MQKTSFGPQEIKQLPRQFIYDFTVQCSACPFNNKVRHNMVRHLRAHLSNEPTAPACPVNPMPCLERKQRMSDYAVNLANSSHEKGRLKSAPNSNDLQVPLSCDTYTEYAPKYIPKSKRYVCGVSGCCYLAINSEQFRQHIKAWHPEEKYFQCPHCVCENSEGTIRHLTSEELEDHFNMHDAVLYKCLYCKCTHYDDNALNRHITDQHPNKWPHLLVMRQLQVKNTKEKYDDNTWKCNLCDYKCTYKTSIMKHATNVHNEMERFKCNGCTFKAKFWLAFNQHVVTEHTHELDVGYTMVFQRIKERERKIEVDPAPVQSQSNDTTPLWSRKKSGVQHIGDILSDDKSEENVVDGEVVHDEEVMISYEKLNVKAVDDKSELKILTEKSQENIVNENKKANPTDADAPAKTNEKLTNLGKSARTKNEKESKAECEYEMTVDNMFICTICNNFKTKFRKDFKEHIYRDIKYFQWHCTGCDFREVSRTLVIKHIKQYHGGGEAKPQISLPNSEIEQWTKNLLKSQADVIKNH